MPNEPLRGAEGREGPAGREGIPGREGLPGIDGAAGDAGEQGERGRTGEALPRSIILSFVIMAAVMVGLLTGFALLARDTARDNRAQVRTNDAFIVNLCEVANENRAALRALLIDARDRTRTSKQRTKDEKAEAEDFYRSALARIPARPCK